MFLKIAQIKSTSAHLQADDIDDCVVPQKDAIQRFKIKETTFALICQMKWTVLVQRILSPAPAFARNFQLAA